MDMKMTDMQMTKKEMKADMPATIGKTDKPKGPQYPWGLSIDLNDDSLDKLGLSIKDLAVGEEVVIHARGKVTNMSMNEYDGEDKRQSCGIQITHMDVVSSDNFEKAFKEAAESKED